MPAGRTFRLAIPSEPQNLVLVREFVGSVGRQAGLGLEDVEQLELAVDEACTNAIRHAHEGHPERDVIVRGRVVDGEVEIEVEDHGGGLDPKRLASAERPPMLTGRRGGLGLCLIRTLVDEVTYERGPGDANELRIVKRARKP